MIGPAHTLAGIDYKICEAQGVVRLVLTESDELVVTLERERFMKPRGIFRAVRSIGWDSYELYRGRSISTASDAGLRGCDSEEACIGRERFTPQAIESLLITPYLDDLRLKEHEDQMSRARRLAFRICGLRPRRSSRKAGRR